MPRMMYQDPQAESTFTKHDTRGRAQKMIDDGTSDNWQDEKDASKMGYKYRAEGDDNTTGGVEYDFNKYARKDQSL